MIRTDQNLILEPESSLLPPCQQAGDDLPKPRMEGLLRGTETVLIVDDEPLVREVIGQLLRRFGHEVLEASGAIEAQRVIDLHPCVDLLVTDFSMPGTNGLELARWSHGTYPHIKVLIITGAMWELADQICEQERVAILFKPFDTLQLGRMVRLVLG